MVNIKLYGIGVNDQVMQIYSLFLSYKRDKIPFKFLGISIGCNPRRTKACGLIIKEIKRKLSTLKGRCISIGGELP